MMEAELSALIPDYQCGEKWRLTRMNVQVTQAELKEIVDLERDIAPKVKRVEELKEGVKALLIAKKPVELGRFDVSLLWRYVRHPAWRQIVVDKLGV
jgi:uncharacterized Fe-S cluster-containing protein